MKYWMLLKVSYVSGPLIWEQKNKK